jgi:hypothetical protein
LCSYNAEHLNLGTLCETSGNDFFDSDHALLRLRAATVELLRADGVNCRR